MKTTIEMAREAGFHISGQHAHSPYIEGSSLTHVLTRFAELVAAGEREACVKVCDDYDDEYDVHTRQTVEGIALQIRARGEIK